MITIAKVAVILFALLIVANGIFQGAVKDAVIEIATSNEKQEMRNTLICLTGLMMYPPVKEVWGINIPIPSFDDVIIAGALTSAILFFLHMINRNLNWKHAVFIFVAIWFTYRMIGWGLITMSGDNCQSVMADMEGTMMGIAAVASLLGLGTIYKIAKTIKG